MTWVCERHNCHAGIAFGRWVRRDSNMRLHRGEALPTRVVTREPVRNSSVTGIAPRGSPVHLDPLYPCHSQWLNVTQRDLDECDHARRRDLG